MEMGKQTAWEEIDKKSSEIFTASDEIWGCAETAFTEDKSMKILCDVLKAEGFTVETGLADVKTAFKGTFGSGKPVIGILGEFDALSGLDQEAGATEKIVVHDGASGHGCGHNMLGTASLSAAIGIKKYLEENIALKKSKEDIPVTGMAVLQQQYTLAEAIEEWIASLKKEINS